MSPIPETEGQIEAKLKEQEKLAERDDPRVQRAKAAGLNAAGVDIRPIGKSGDEDYDHRFERHQELGHVPSDGSDLGPAKEILVELDDDGSPVLREITPEEREALVAEAEKAEGDEVGDLNVEELREEATRLDIPGRSSMDKAELAEAVREAQENENQ